MLDPGWAAVITKPHAEEVAERDIRIAGYRVYLPRYRKVLIGYKIGPDGKRKRSRTGEIVLRPLFPRYLFAELHPKQQWAGIEHARGVSDLIWWGDKPALMRAEVVDAIREDENAGTFDEARSGKAQVLKGFAAKQVVRIETGPFASHIGEIAELDDGEARVVVMLKMLGAERPVIARGDQLELVTA